MKIAIIWIPFLAFTAALIFFFIKRYQLRNAKSNRLGVVQISFAMLIFNLIVYLSWIAMYYVSQNVYDISIEGEKYTGTVVNLKYNPPDSDGDPTLPTPTIQFTTESGKTVVKELNFAEDKGIGETYKIYYNESKDKVFPLGGILIARIVLAYFFCFIMTYIFAYLLVYILSERFSTINLFQRRVLYYYIPLLLIGFNIMMICLLCYDDKIPVWVAYLLIPIAAVLGVATIGFVYSKVENNDDFTNLDRTRK